jgi:hypothetical protein
VVRPYNKEYYMIFVGFLSTETKKKCGKKPLKSIFRIFQRFFNVAKAKMKLQDGKRDLFCTL